MTTTILTAAAATPSAGSTQLIFAALVGIALIVLLITQLKLHPFLSLTIGSIAVGGLAGMQLKDTLVSFGAGGRVDGGQRRDADRRGRDVWPAARRLRRRRPDR
jgi:O-antigen ligase